MENNKSLNNLIAQAEKQKELALKDSINPAISTDERGK